MSHRHRRPVPALRKPLASNVVNRTLNSIKSTYNKQHNEPHTDPLSTELTFALRPVRSKKQKSLLTTKEQYERQSCTHRITSEYQHLTHDTNLLHVTNDNTILRPKHLYTTVRKFTELPLSQRTLTALDAAKYKRLTNIQRATLPYTLCGNDVLGNAETGSGKTLAFLIPAVELLWRTEWNRQLDGLAALIISPTRELAIQIFDVLRVIGCNHNISAGLVIGGKSFDEESSKIHAMNILVCTPGRLLQHLEQSYTFTMDTLKLLVLDEVDKILDMGFQTTINDILTYLPKHRQTLLFSATINDTVNQLARLSLNHPIHVDVNPSNTSNTSSATDSTSVTSTHTTDKLEQSYVIINAELKLDLLLSFIKTHLRSKCIVFVSSCKQVRYLYEIYRRIRPGIPLMHIHGKMSQTRRMQMYYDFCNKQYACIFATDIASRGLDFPAVDWIVQLDCPDSVPTYIHRIGRTARYKSKGKAMLCLLPSEQSFIQQLTPQQSNQTIHIKRVRINEKQLRSTVNQIQSFLAESTELADLTRKAYTSYVRSVYLQSDKSVFNVAEIPLEPLALSMGLQRVPNIKFVASVKHRKNMPYALQQIVNKHNPSNVQHNNNTSDTTTVDKLLSRHNIQYERRLEEINNHMDTDTDTSDTDNDDDDILISKLSQHTHHNDSALTEHDVEGRVESRIAQREMEYADHVKKQEQKKQLFESYVQKSDTQLHHNAINDMVEHRYVNNIADRISAADRTDRVTEQERLRARRLKLKRRERMANAERNGQIAGAVLKAVHGNESNDDADTNDDSDNTSTLKRIKSADDPTSLTDINTAEQIALKLLNNHA